MIIVDVSLPSQQAFESLVKRLGIAVSKIEPDCNYRWNRYNVKQEDINFLLVACGPDKLFKHCNDVYEFIYD